ncbi:MAG: acyltransferase domain-containing protein [Nitriliruptorales bacterium]|nr:acyltransferase domain-containing protein [Nitriliruptorales bacterium]
MSAENVQALVFPGQGSQRPGMARAWRDHPAAKRWVEAGEVLGWDVARLGTEADAEELREPAKCQIALFVHQAVLLDAWREAGGQDPVAVAGHSLGEYDALVAAGVLGFAEALKLVDARARHTQTAAAAMPGTMVACVGYPDGVVEAACAEVGVHVANDNAPGQVVVAGSAEALDTLRARLSKPAPEGDGGRPARGKVLDVNVGAAYHSPHMAPAVEPFGEALDRVAFAEAAVPVVANVDAEPHTSAGEWPDLLRRQVVTPVRWRDSVTTFRRLGVTEVVELGASPVLTNMVKRIDRSLQRRTVSEPEDL